MACYQCGSNAGTSASLCPDCRAANRARREGNVAAIRAGVPGGRMSGAMHRSMNAPIIWFSAVLALFCGMSAWVLFVSSDTSVAPRASIFTALLLTAMIVNVFCWGLFWVNMLVVEPIWAIACFFFPILVYRYVILRFDECRWAVITHVLCLVAMVVAYLGLVTSRGG